MKRTKFKKITSYFLAIAIVLTMMPINVEASTGTGNWQDAGNVAASFAGGDGTQASPYQISTAEQLALLAKKVNNNESNEENLDYNAAYYELTEDIDLGAHEWMPIGTYEGSDYYKSFFGHFDGKGHKISNVIVGTEESPYSVSQYAGLFGYSNSGSTIENIGVSVNAVSTKQMSGVGGLVGYCSRATINNSYSTGFVSSTGMMGAAGGLVGVHSGTINNSYSTAVVTVGNGRSGNVGLYAKSGGLVGYNNRGEINNSYATGDVTGGSNAFVGGLVGFDESGIISNGYYNTDATRKVNNLAKPPKGIDYGTDSTTGKTSTQMKDQAFVDELNGNVQDGGYTWVAVINDYPTCTVTPQPIQAKTLTVTVSPGTATGSTKAEITETATSKFVVNITDSEVSTPNTSDAAPTSGDNLIVGYTSGADITTGAAVDVYLQAYDVDGNGKVAGFYQQQLTTDDIKTVTLTYWEDNIGSVSDLTGSGTEAGPYQINSAEELAYLAKQVNAGDNYSGKYIELTQDIDLAAHQWTPIGDSSKDFNGYFDGNGYEISHVMIGTKDISSTYNYAGLFANTGSDATIENVGVSVSIYSSTNFQVGGLVASNNGTINNSYTTGDIIAKSANYIGGLVGYNYSNGTINNSYATGDITGDSSGVNAGGLVGFNQTNGTIINSYATGDITAGGSDAYVGGLIGYSMGTIGNSYATGNVTGGSGAHAGGLAGASNNVKISNCYATGNVSGKFVGGLLGVNWGTGIIIGSYYNSDATQTKDGTAQSVKKGIGSGTGTAYGIPESTMNSSSQQVEGALVDRLNNGIGTNTEWYSWKQDPSVNSGYPTHVVITKPKIPTVETTSPVKNIETTSVTVDGNVTGDGNGTLSEIGIVYGTTINPSIDTATTVLAKNLTTGAFSIDLTGLTSDTTYHVRAYATNEVGTSYGEDVEFTTVKEYTVTFKDWDETVLKTQSVEKGSSATAPTDPTRSGYSFTGWNKDFSNITEDITITATYRKNSSSSGHSHRSTNKTQIKPTEEKTTVIVNGKKQIAGTETVKEENGQKTVEVKADSKVISQKIDEALKEKEINNNTDENTIEIPVAAKDAKNIKNILTGDIVKKMEDNEFTLAVNTDKIDYIIPAKEVGIEKVASTLGVTAESLKDIEVSVEIQDIDESIAKEITEKAKAGGYDIVFPPVEFKVVAKTTTKDNETKETEVSRFSSYVKRVMEVPEGVDPSKITTGIVYNPDGTFSHIPTSVFEKDGKWYARLNSLTNSDYSVIWNPIKVVAVENHWSKKAVNDMASRLVIDNPTTFMPDENITRGEFAEYITKALGLYRTGVAKEDKFTDVSITNNLADAIEIATEYGIINGYPDGTFKPEAQITREEAMVMYARAMDIAGLKEIDNIRIESYTDKEVVADWAYDYVRKTIGAGVFNGRTNDIIAPKGTFSYAEAATAIRNLLTASGLINE